jgi:hypothetical protein
MPFVTQDHRDNPDMLIPGDICYTFYRDMVIRWKKQPRWTTAHNIYKEMTDILRQSHVSDLFRKDCDQCAAYKLAWQVFFQLYVMPYELEKRQQNGDI